MISVTIYTTGEGCPQCRLTRKHLERRQLAFTEVDLTQAGRDAVREWITSDLGYMPKHARPAGSERAEQSIAIIGNLVKARMIYFLRQRPGSGRKDIVEALDVPPATIAMYLRELEEAGLVIGDPPRGVRSRGEWPVYAVDDLAVTELYLKLGQEIGEL